MVDSGRVSVAESLARMGGVATRGELIAASSRRELEQAVRAGGVVMVARGRYALATADEAVVTAHRLCGVVSHGSAALQHGWQVKLVPERPHVTIAKNRVLVAGQDAGVDLHRTTLGPDDVNGMVTSQERTLIDCLRVGEFDEGLCIADSALRDGFSPSRLAAIARDARGPGSRRVREVAEHADGASANAFESTLRAIALRVPGLDVRPQVSLYASSFLGRPDLVDERLGIVLEADSFEWHGDRAALRRDAQRYNRFVVHGWLVLRFAWEDVMFRPDEVRAILEAAVAERTEHGRRCRCAA
jgi:very-short-patch-repair endonuclease